MSDTLPPKEGSPEYVIHDYVEPVARALQGEPLNPEVAKFLKEFDGFDLDREIEKEGKEKVTADVSKAQELLAAFGISSRITAIVDRVQQIQPDKKMRPVPIYLVYAKKNSGGTSLLGTAIVINIRETSRRVESGEVKDTAEALDRLERIAAHEGTHVFTTQLGLSPDDVEYPLLKNMWGEGLASYIDGRTLKGLEIETEELRFWMGMLWQRAELPDYEQWKEVVRRYIDPDVNPYIEKRNLIALQHKMEQGESPFWVAWELMSMRSGLFYFLCDRLWRYAIGKGKPLPELVRAGHEQMSEWIKGYAEELEQE